MVLVAYISDMPSTVMCNNLGLHLLGIFQDLTKLVIIKKSTVMVIKRYSTIYIAYQSQCNTMAKCISIN